MTADPKLGEVIAASLQLVITLHEGSKARRAAAKHQCYDRVYKIFDWHSDVSSKWRWRLERLAARYQLPIAVKLNTATVDPEAGMLSHLEDSFNEIRPIHQSFVNGYEVAQELGIKPAKRRFGKLIDKCEYVIEEMEAYARQVADSEKPGGKWLMEKM